MTRVRWLRALSAAVAAVALLVAVVEARPRAPRLRRLVVVGDSLLAGFSSGGLVARGRAGQRQSAPAFLARRARVPLPQPLIGRPGLPPQLRIVDDDGDGRLDAGEVRRRPTGIGFRRDADVEARNLAVPGEDTATLFEELQTRDLASGLLAGDLSGPDALKLVLLGLPLRDGPISQLRRARELRPTFVMIWIGNNDVLSMATRTQPGVATLAPAEFGARIGRLFDELAPTRADMAIANLPDPTVIAALRRAAGEVVACRTQAGAIEPVGPDDLLSVDQDPASLPTPPCNDVLSVAERDEVRAKVQAYNAALAAAVAAAEARHGLAIALVDMFAGVDGLDAGGLDLDGDGVPDLGTGYLGGIFSLDGIHPSATGNAVIANAFIAAINARFGEAIPPVDVRRVAARDPLVGSRFRPAGEPPFGLLGDDAADDVEMLFEDAADAIERNLDQLRDDLRDLVEELF